MPVRKRKAAESAEPITFGTFLNDYDKYIGELAASTQAKYRAHLRKHIRPAFGELKMSDVTTKEIELWLVGKKRDGMAWATRYDLRNLLSGIFTVAERWGNHTGPNPVRKVPVGRKYRVRTQKKLSDLQISILLAELPADVAVMVRMSLYCTLRISEVLGLCWKHLDFETGTVHVLQRYWRGDVDSPKTDGAARDVPLGHLVTELRLLYPGPESANDYVFSVKTRCGSTRSDSTIARYFLKPVAKRLGLYFPGFGFHTFRRHAVTAIAAAAGPIQAMRAAGHSRMDMTLLYGLVDFEGQQTAIRGMQDSIEQASKSPVVPIPRKDE